ncbi:serine protease 1 [Stomoxys calcitrans]|uniref:serine protease 1 n=1 Tax=Stomoxys calcitrans TaxID=35570 RepID=UPI0027E27904|nr:serine protease 1 [Stomoxys calcitrans]
MKVLLVLSLALACASAAPGYEIPVVPRDLIVAGAPEGRITNGQQAAPGQFPYQVGLSLQTNAGSFWCGGSLIGNTWILTAAHCTDGAFRVTAYLGSTVRTVASVVHSVDASNIYQHSGYNAYYLSNDISLIRILAVAYSNLINIARLPAISSAYSTYAGDYAIASGWGRTADTGSVANNLNYARFEVITNAACNNYYIAGFVNSGTLCISTPNGKSTCQGDSGGPLVLENTNLLIGVTSFVPTAGCTVGGPAGFVRVTTFLPWIRDISGIAY